MSEQYKALQGFNDILPEERPYWRLVEKTTAEVAELYGYRRIETPTLEETAVRRRACLLGAWDVQIATASQTLLLESAHVAP